MSGDELLAMVFLLLIAGHETTVNLIGNGTLALLTHPEQRARLAADPDLWPGAVDELLRFEPPLANTLSRVTTAPVHLDGITIEADVPHIWADVPHIWAAISVDLPVLGVAGGGDGE